MTIREVKSRSVFLRQPLLMGSSAHVYLWNSLYQEATRPRRPASHVVLISPPQALATQLNIISLLYFFWIFWKYFQAFQPLYLSTQPAWIYWSDMEGATYANKTDLHRAVCSRDVSLCEKLLQEGASVDSPDRCGISPLEEASLRGYDNIVNILQPHSKIPPHVWQLSDLTCPICFAVYVKPITLGCGHTFCRSCIQLSRRPHNRCSLCRKPVQFENGKALDLFPNDS